MSALVAREYYAARGIADTIPLAPGTKRPIAAAWQDIPPDQQWRMVKRPDTINIGLRHGSSVVNVECDCRKVASTFDHVMAGLRGMGITDPPVVRSASRVGRHVYLRCDDLPGDVSFRILAREVGAGELRIGRGAISVLPWSRVDGATYELIGGAFEAVPIVEWHDLLWLLPMQRIVTADESLPVRLIWRPLTPDIDALFEAVANAGRGDTVSKYPSRSEAEAAIVSSLILNGWTFAEIRAEFARRSVGHYADAKRRRDRYLANTYANALAVITSSSIRQALAVDFRAAELAAWSGRSGNSDRAVYLAVLSECYRAGAIETSMSEREIAEHAAIQPGTAHKALKRVAKRRLIERTRGANEDGTLAAVWKRGGDLEARVTVNKAASVSPPYPTVTPASVSPPPEISAWNVLGKSAVTVYQHLDPCDAKSIKALSRATGRARSTVRSALERLSRYQLAVRTDGGGWLAGPNDLQSVADEFGCDERAEKRRAKHARQRASYRAFRERLKVKRQEAKQPSARGTSRNTRRT